MKGLGRGTGKPVEGKPIVDYAVGIDMGATNLKALAVDAEGAELARRTRTTRYDRDGLIASVREEIAALVEVAGSPPRWLGIASPGLAARDGRFIAWMKGRFEVVEGLDWGRELGSGAPRPWVLNDGHAATLGEAWLGAAAGSEDVLVLTLGTGIGGGIVSGGRLLTGHLGRAGHVGHLVLDVDGPPDICGTPGSLEDAVGNATLGQDSGGRFASTEELVAAVADGHPQAQELWRARVRALACGMVSLINVVDPEVVVLGGGIARAGDRLFEPLLAELHGIEWRPNGGGVRVVAAALGEFAGAIGAARHAMLKDSETEP